jgi:outer membrane receptor protein involved in Fe transport
MNSQGTIFTDFDGPLKYNEYGVYTQLQKKFMDDRLKFTGSVRYDKSQNFEGQFSPRVSFVYSAGEKKNHNFRVSFQTGFRNPTTQDQYIGLDLGPFALIGSAADNLTRFRETININPLGLADNGGNSTVTLTGVDAYTRAYSVSSVTAFQSALLQGTPIADASKLLVKANTTLVKPEQVKAFEAGYKTVLDNGLSVDINGYYNIYNDFMSTARVITPLYGAVGSLEEARALSRGDRRVFQIYTNTSSEITSYGAGVGLSKKIFGDFEIGTSYNYAKFDFDQASDPTFIAGFNTPEHRAKASLGNDKLFKNFGFMVNGRWWSEYEWQSSFADGTIPSTAVLDAQISYTIPSLKTVIKLSGSNIGQNDYLQVIGAGRIGQMYMASITYNP